MGLSVHFSKYGNQGPHLLFGGILSYQLSSRLGSWSFQNENAIQNQQNPTTGNERSLVYRKWGDCFRDSPVLQSMIIQVIHFFFYQRSYSSSLKTPLTFYDFRILLITHSFYIIISECNAAHTPLSRTLSSRPPLPLITDRVWSRNFHLPLCILMLIVKSVMRSSRQFHFVNAHPAILISLEC